MTATRRLAAIVAADVAGYSRLMGADEEGAAAPRSVLPSFHHQPRRHRYRCRHRCAETRSAVRVAPRSSPRMEMPYLTPQIARLSVPRRQRSRLPARSGRAPTLFSGPPEDEIEDCTLLASALQVLSNILRRRHQLRVSALVR